MSSLLRNLRYTIRALANNLGLTLTILLTLALGIGANTAIFTVDYASMLAPLPYPQPDQLVMVWSKVQGHRSGVSAGDFEEWKRQSTAFQSLGAWSADVFNIADKEQPEQIEGSHTTAGYYQTIGQPFYLGRDFLPDEAQPGKDHVVILTHKLWKRLGSDPNILGKPIRLNGEPYTVVGVWAPGLADRGEMLLTVPLVFKPEQLNHDFRWLLVLGRMKPGVSIQQTQADMNRVTAELAKSYPKSNTGFSAAVEPLKDDWLSNDRRTMLWLLMGAVAFVLLIACANVANLLLARGMSRQKEVAIRVALGATSRKIFAQQLTESLLLAIVGGLSGLGVGFAILSAIRAIVPPGMLPLEAELRFNLPVLLFTLAATTVAGFVFGCGPAWYASRVDPGELLKEGGRAGVGLSRHRLRRSLVILEFALALALLAGAGLAIHSFWNLEHVDLGIRTDHVLTFSLGVPGTRPKDPDRIIAYYHQILDSIRSVPGVSRVAAMTGMPLEGPGLGTRFSLSGNLAIPDPSRRPGAGFQMVTPDYFQTLGIRIVKGRGFTAEDNATGVKVAVVNEDFVSKFLRGTDPLQQRVVVEQIIPGAQRLGPPIEWEIVGVSHTLRWGLGDSKGDDPEIDVPFWQSPWPSAGISVLTGGDPAAMTKSIAAAIHQVDSQVALGNPRTIDQLRDDVLVSDKFTMLLFIAFAGIGLLLAAVGIYGVMAFSVAQRSHEIAVRMALGASRNRVIALVVREGMLLASVGLALGLIGAYFVGRAMQGMLFGVEAMDFFAFGAVRLILLLTALLASFLPAWSASSVEPMRALRSE